jgi:hypothetical protein
MGHLYVATSLEPPEQYLDVMPFLLFDPDLDPQQGEQCS